jgi:ankyrin repeat protein
MERDVNSRDNMGRTLLHMVPLMAVLIGDSRLPKLALLQLNKAEILANFGANVNAKDSVSWTPLHYVSRLGLINIVKLLLERGADPNAKGSIGETPLHLASLKDPPT